MLQSKINGDLRVVWDKFIENVNEKKADSHAKKKILKNVWMKLKDLEEKSGQDEVIINPNQSVFIELLRQKIGE